MAPLVFPGRILLSRAITKPPILFSSTLAKSATSTVNANTPLATSSTSTSPSIPESTNAALELIRSEPNHYVIANFLGRKLLLSPRDLLTVPRIKDVAVGDILSLSAISEVGSRMYTLRGDPTLPKDTVRVHATVVEHTKGKLEKIVKFKRRKGYHRMIQHKQTYTRLRIGPIEIPPNVQNSLASASQ